jgi:hypothetical protein
VGSHPDTVAKHFHRFLRPTDVHFFANEPIVILRPILPR